MDENNRPTDAPISMLPDVVDFMPLIIEAMGQLTAH